LTELAAKVRIKHPIDPDSVAIHKDPFYTSAYIITLPLESNPSYVWQTLFEQELWSSLDFWDRKVIIVGKEIKLVTTRDRVGEKLGWLEELVNATNRRVEEHNRKVGAEKEAKKPGRMDEEALRSELTGWLSRRGSG
jgi:hypothetical protein